VPPGRRLRLLKHLDFNEDELDPAVITCMEKERSTDLDHELSIRFAYPHQVVNGRRESRSFGAGRGSIPARWCTVGPEFSYPALGLESGASGAWRKRKATSRGGWSAMKSGARRLFLRLSSRLDRKLRAYYS
jgi:hypothetical protein